MAADVACRAYIWWELELRGRGGGVIFYIENFTVLLKGPDGASISTITLSNPDQKTV